MKKISIISACTDLGLKIDGAELGAQALTEGLKPSNISQNYILKGSKKSEESHSNSDSNDINSFVSKFDDYEKNLTSVLNRALNSCNSEIKDDVTKKEGVM